MRPSNSIDPELMKFLIEKTKDAKSPLNISRLAEEFKKKSGSSKSDECWRKRAQKFRSEIQQMDSVDTEVKVKIVFGLSAPVDRIFLNELQKDALVEVDENNRITRYKANDGSLELEGDHSQPAKKMLETIDDKWKSDPEYIELTKFLIEKTKDANSPLSIRQVAEEFKKTSGSSQSVDCLRKRAKRFRSKIHKMYSIDKETTVKLLFALSASTDKDVLNELQKDALVEVDENNRITKFKANDGSLELEGDHSQPAKKILKTIDDECESDPEYIDLMAFLIEKTKDAESALSIRQVAEEFKKTSGSSQKFSYFLDRINTLRSSVSQMDSIDEETKWKLVFTLTAPIDEDFLNELRKDADVEVDKKNRIIKYESHDGSLELTGDHSQSAKCKEGWKRRRMRSEKNAEDSDDGSKDPVPKTRGSTKRAAVAEVSAISKRARDRLQKTVDGFMNDAGDGSITLAVESPGSIKRPAAAEESTSSKRTKNSAPTPVLNFDDYAPDDSVRDHESRSRDVVRQFSPPPTNPRIQQHRQPKLEEVTPETTGARQEATILKAETPEAHSPQATSIKPEPDEDDAFTSQIKFLETIQSLVVNLGMPSLSPLQAKIDEMLRKFSDEKIPNHEMILAMEVFVMTINKSSVSILNESVESISLKEFLCYLKAAINNSKSEGLEVLMEKIKARIRDLPLKDKSISVEKVASALQTTLAVIEF